ncbi:MAG: methyl-accepting chemotaxis protein [Aquabacterium sp.]|nr:methyl-accepting chemotaxis protein [Aquabacterium sp.]
MSLVVLGGVERRSPVHRVLNHVSIRLKLGALAAISALVMVGLGGWLTWQNYLNEIEGRKIGLRQNVETAASVLRWAHGLETARVVSTAQAQALALQALQGARYGGNEYYWINDMSPRMVMHPIKPALNGQDVGGMRDPDGTPLFLRFVETVRSQRAGYVAYRWPKPGEDAPVEKLSYVAGFEPWGWVIGSGLYMDDLRSAFMVQVRHVAGLICAALAATLLALHLVYASIMRGLAKAARVARAIADGDVSREILLVGSDEIGDLIGEMKRMSDQLNTTMGEVHDAAASLSFASQEIAAANHDLSGRTERTAANLQQAAQSLGQVTSSVQGNTEAAHRAGLSAASAAEVATEGGDIVGRAVHTMADISSASHRIADITGVIDGIAFQTNILALNAAVEAARAGEQGRGFAVVAAEVRMLAQRSATAAREIKGLIQASVERTDAGAALVNEAGAAMQRIVASVREVNAQIHDITQASAEQGSGIGQVNHSVGELDQMTQQNAALVEQSAAAAESLKSQALRLSSAVRSFKLDAERRLQPAG